MIYIISIIIIFLGGVEGFTQDKYFTREGQIKFFSKAPLEDIDAISKKANAIFDAGTSEVVARVSIKTFDFKKKLMREHFNENYLESDKYPRGEFKGRLKDFDFDKMVPGEKSNYLVEGELSIHGKTKKINTIVSLELLGDIIHAKASFKIRVKDYDIKIPKIVIKNIAEEITISLDFDIKKLE